MRTEYSGEVEHRDTIRKGAKLLYEYLEAGWLHDPAEVKDVPSPSNAENTLSQLKKERYKIQTEKLELNRWLRENARDELIVEHICQAIAELEPLDIPAPIFMESNNRAGILIFGDEHYGTEFTIRGLSNEVINAYSPEIFEDRMWDLLNQTIQIVQKENFSKIYVFSMGDFEDGLLRVKQLMQLRYGVDNPNFTFIENPTGLIYADILGYQVCGIHGEVKSMEQAIKDFSQKYRVQLDFLIAGHKHHAKSETVGINQEVINVPSIIGVDDFSMSINKTSNAGATFLVLEHGRGKTIEYAIKL